jgi:transcriptional regulator with XRE-family HTH domain
VPRERITEATGPDAELFGQRLRELREKRKLTQGALADLAQMSLPYVSELERGVKVPSLTTLVRLAVALNCKLSALIAPFDKTDLRTLLPK